MRHEDSHPSDEELMLAADGELSPAQAKKTDEHLAACWDCRARRARLEATISDLVAARHAVLDSQIPSEIGRRALLKAHLAELAAQPAAQPGLSATLTRRLLIPASVAALILVSMALTVLYRSRTSESALPQIVVEPSPRLTPGATRPVKLADVCNAEGDGRARVIPISLRQQVFQEYGMANASPADYEVDFLITPELGGSNDIHNLWPEPYSSTVWNAHVKDELEDRLRQMVCDGQLDLATAQRDISADWIQAYKKYFHTERPL
jgi:hypothetical protein